MKKILIISIFLFGFSTNINAEEISCDFHFKEAQIKIADLDFVEFIKDTIILQPEYRKAIARKGEFLANKKYAQRLRFPTLEAQVYNDRTISRDITANDYQSALRKTRDDTFDGIISIDQKIFQGFQGFQGVQGCRNSPVFSYLHYRGARSWPRTDGKGTD